MKNYKPWLILSLLLLFGLVSLSIIQKQTQGILAEKKAELWALQKIHIEEKAKAEKTIKEMEQRIATISEQNKVLSQKSKNLEIQLAEGERKIKELEAARPSYPEECREIVNHLQREIEAWKKQFSLAIEDRDIWKKSSLLAEEKYQAQKIVTEQKEKIIEQLIEEGRAHEEVIKSLQKTLIIEKTKAKLFGGSAILVGGILLFSLIK